MTPLSKERYRKVRSKIDGIEKEEEKLKKELETVRNNVSYYRSLVSDMKKKIKGRKSLDFFDQL
ncbi:MAG: hypothetical protein R6W73_05790 [Candidatus Saliniplasma sp.]